MSHFCQYKRHTLSGKLMILFIATAALIAVSVGSILAWSFRAHFEENLRPHLIQYFEHLQEELGTPPNQDNARALATKLSLEIHYFGGNQQWSTSDTIIELDNIELYRTINPPEANYRLGRYNDHEYLISYHDDYTLAFSSPHNESQVRKIIPIIVVLIVLVLLYYATRRLFAPINDIKRGISRFGSGDLSHRLDIKRRDELGELGCSINAMADDIEHMLEAKRQLLLAISHELRSPLTRAKVALALLDDKETRSEIQQDLDEMETLIEELLETERLNTRHSVLHKSPTVVQTLITELTGEYFPGNGFKLDMPEQEITLGLDQPRIKLLLKNLLENALLHNPAEAEPPELRVTDSGHAIYITVTDHGQGIEAQHLPQIAEPFYRTDKARQRKTGGYGLGLYLCKVIAEAHGGLLNIESTLGKGTVVSITLPKNHSTN